MLFDFCSLTHSFIISLNWLPYINAHHCLLFVYKKKQHVYSEMGMKHFGPFCSPPSTYTCKLLFFFFFIEKIYFILVFPNFFILFYFFTHDVDIIIHTRTHASFITHVHCPLCVCVCVCACVYKTGTLKKKIISGYFHFHFHFTSPHQT